MQLNPQLIQMLSRGMFRTPGINPNAPQPGLPQADPAQPAPAQDPRWMQGLNSPLGQIGLRMLAGSRDARGNPVGLGPAAGGAVLGYQQGEQDKVHQDLQRQYLQAQIKAMGLPNPSSAEAFGQPEAMMGPDGKMVLVQAGNRGTIRPVEGYRPNPLNQYGRVNPGDFTPESMSKYSQSGDFADLVRIWAPDNVNVAGVQTQVGRQAGGIPTSQPLTDIGTVAANAAQVAGAEAGAKSTASADAERQAGIRTSARSARNALSLFEGADALIDKAPAGWIDRGGLGVVRAFGVNSEAANAQSRLEALSLNAVLDRIKSFGANPTEGERAALLSSLGDLANPAKTRGERKAALEETRGILRQIEDRAKPSTPAPQAALDYLKANPDKIADFEKKYGYRPDGF